MYRQFSIDCLMLCLKNRNASDNRIRSKCFHEMYALHCNLKDLLREGVIKVYLE